MEPLNINRDIARLPPEAQRQVFDFIAFLKTRYKKTRPDNKNARNKIAEDPFIGIWEDRTDIEDSSLWVRRARKSEWG